MNNIIDICGKGREECVIEILAKFNRGINNLIIRAIGGDISKGVEIAFFLYKEFSIKVHGPEIKSINVNGIETPCVEVALNGSDIQTHPDVRDYDFPGSKFIDFPVYHLLLDWWLFKMGELKIYRYDGTPLITIIDQDGTIRCQRNIKKTMDEKIFYGVGDAFYRCGLLLPSNWEGIAKKLSEFDDVILGIDTNILYNCTITEHLLPTLSLIDPKEFVHTPNWILFVIPSAVMHELEEAANIRHKGLLQVEGRMGFRALQEIIELNQSADISGISLFIVGEANPVLDTRVELQGLREDFYKRDQNKSVPEEKIMPFRSRKTSSGDMIIRDQFKKFLQQLNFHKGIYFLTADKSNAALARAEGLHPIYFHFPFGYYENNSEVELYKVSKEKEIKMGVSIGELIYEMAVQFGTIKINLGNEEIKIQCDTKGENLDYWLYRNLRIEQNDFNKLKGNYAGKFSLKKMLNVWNKLIKKFKGVEEI